MLQPGEVPFNPPWELPWQLRLPGNLPGFRLPRLPWKWLRVPLPPRLLLQVQGVLRPAERPRLPALELLQPAQRRRLLALGLLRPVRRRLEVQELQARVRR